MIVGICGLIGSGKGTVADILTDQYGWTKISFADSLKDAVAAVFNWPRHLLEGDTADSRTWREQVDTWWSARLGIADLTPRWVLQQWGTEVCRYGFHDDIWVASMENKMQDQSRNYVIPDTRFPNEIDMIARNHGQTWWIRRGLDPQWFSDWRNGHDSVLTRSDIHPSEYMWARSRFHAVIDNGGSLDQLQAKIAQLIC